MPRIDMAGLEHRLVEHSMVLSDGLLQAGATPWEDQRGRVDSRAAPSRAEIQEAARIDRVRFQGAWRPVSRSAGGQPGGARADLRWILGGSKWIIADNKIVMQLENRLEGKFTLDPAKLPRRIEIVITSVEGTTTEKIHGVYELRGDELYVCLDSSDEPYPASIRSAPGTAQVSLELRRERP